MRVDLTGKTIAQIVADKVNIMRDKCSLPIDSEPINYSITATKKPVVISKAAGGGASDPNVVNVTIIGNTFKFCDSHMDVLAPGCATKTIKERGLRIHHLKDHMHRLGGKIGITKDIYTDLIGVSEFGIESDVKTTESIFMNSDVKRALDEQSFTLYKEEEVDQHSIGMQYMRLVLAVNDPEFKEEFATWEKHYEDVINKELIDSRGFFWWVTEIKLFEISAVLFGANELTPTVDTKKSIQAPLKDTLDKDDPTPPADTLDDEMKRRRILLTHI